MTTKYIMTNTAFIEEMQRRRREMFGKHTELDYRVDDDYEFSLRPYKLDDYCSVYCSNKDR